MGADLSDIRMRIYMYVYTHIQTYMCVCMWHYIGWRQRVCT